MHASQDLARKIKHEERVLAERAKVEQEQAQQKSLDLSLDTTTNTVTMLANGSVVDIGSDTADSTLNGAADARPHLGQDKAKFLKRGGGIISVIIIINISNRDDKDQFGGNGKAERAD
ncbi:hypothetical protein BGX34_008587 [Mortierella sp. NVP85]|nr:hypothetical protein BGX34_008587 [Mortierella sp. NVP85]